MEEAAEFRCVAARRIQRLTLPRGAASRPIVGVIGARKWGRDMHEMGVDNRVSVEAVCRARPRGRRVHSVKVGEGRAPWCAVPCPNAMDVSASTWRPRAPSADWARGWNVDIYAPGRGPPAAAVTRTFELTDPISCYVLAAVPMSKVVAGRDLKILFQWK